MAKHLTAEERGVLYRLKKGGMSRAGIGRLMGRHRSTIGRELARNSGGRGYRPKQAQRLAEARRPGCRRHAKLEDGELRRYVARGLRLGWSPEQIAGRLPRDFPRRPRMRVSRQAIYDWARGRAPQWRPLLRRGGRRPETRGKLPGRARIDGRPEVINRRLRYGDWEGDTVVGKRRRGALVTLVERKSGYLRMGRAGDLTAATASRVTRRRMRRLPPGLRRSLTLDNGKEFARHGEVSRALGLDVYFAAPHRPWQRGTNENTNGLVRQFFPKDTDLAAVAARRVARVEALLNGRPRKRLGYRTPAEVLAKRLRCD